MPINKMTKTLKYIRFMYLTKIERRRSELLDETPPGSWMKCHESYLMHGQIFVSWFKGFIGLQLCQFCSTNARQTHLSHKKTFNWQILHETTSQIFWCSHHLAIIACSHLQFGIQLYNSPRNASQTYIYFAYISLASAVAKPSPGLYQAWAKNEPRTHNHSFSDLCTSHCFHLLDVQLITSLGQIYAHI
jgi:hypothetical protein